MKSDMSKIGSSTTKFEVEKFNDKKLRFMVKEGESVAGATGPSQDLAG